VALLERLAILITADASSAMAEMKKVSATAITELGAAERTTAGFSQNVSKAGAVMLGAGAGLLAVGVAAASSTTELGREVIKLQRYTGMTAEEASKLKFAAQESGVSVESLGLGLIKLSKSAEANNPAFAALGVSTRDAHGNIRSMGELLPDVAEQFKNMPNGVEKTALATQLFGRAGNDLVPLLNKGRDGIKALSDEAEKMGLVLSGDNVAAIQKHIQNQREMKAVIEGVKTQIGLSMIPVLDTFTDVLKGIPGPVKDVAGPIVVMGGIVLVAAGALGMLVGQIENLVPAISKMISGFSTVMETAGPVGWAILGVTIAMGALVLIMQTFGKHSDIDQKAATNFAAALKEVGPAAEKGITATIAAGLASAKLSDAFDRSGVSASQMQAAVRTGGSQLMDYARMVHDTGLQSIFAVERYKELPPAMQAYVQSLRSAVNAGMITNEEFDKLLNKTGHLAVTYEDTKTKSDNLATSTSNLAPTVSELAQAQGAAASATTEHRKAMEDLDSKIHAMLDPMFGMIDASQRVADAQKKEADTTLAVSYASVALDEARKGGNQADIAKAENDLATAQRNHSDALTGSRDAALSYNIAQDKLIGLVRDQPQALAEAIIKVDAWKESGHLSAEAAGELEQKLKDAAAQAEGFPDAVHMKAYFDRSELQAGIDKIHEMLNLVPQLDGTAGRGLGIYKQPGQAMGGHIGGAAMGAYGDGPHLVGELGPEIFWPDKAGTIIPTEKSAGMMGGGSSVQNNYYSISVDVPVSASPADVGKAIVQMITEYQRSNGTSWQKVSK
jgi:hypothetical protein